MTTKTARRLAGLTAALLVAVPASAQARTLLDSQPLLRFGDSGEPVSIDPAPDGTFFVTMVGHDSRAGAMSAPIVQIGRDGTVLRRVHPAYSPGPGPAVERRPWSTLSDAHGRLHVVTGDRVLRLPAGSSGEGAQVWATIPDLPNCADVSGSDCHRSPMARSGPAAFYGVWTRDGAMLLADDNYNVVWRVPPGGGTAKLWAVADGLLGREQTGSMYQLALSPDGRRLYVAAGLAVTGGPLLPGTGGILAWDIAPDGSAAAGPRVIWQSLPGEGTYGVAVARSGNLVVTNYLLSSLVKITPDGRELAHTSELTTRLRDVPPDNPSGITWAGDGVLVANPSAHLQIKRNRAILDVFAGEVGAEPIFPANDPPTCGPRRVRLRLSTSQRRVVRVEVRVDGRRVALRRGRRLTAVTVGVPGSGRHRVVATLRDHRGRRTTVSRTVPACSAPAPASPEHAGHG